MESPNDRPQICYSLGFPSLLELHTFIARGAKQDAAALLRRGLAAGRLMALGYHAEGMTKLGYSAAILAQLGYSAPPAAVGAGQGQGAGAATGNGRGSAQTPAAGNAAPHTE